MKHYSSPHSRLCTLLSCSLSVCLALPVWAQSGTAFGGSSARPGTPSFLSAVDTTLRLWSGQVQKINIYLLIIIALVVAYLTGKIAYEIIFGSGTYAPRAASTASWFGAIVLLLIGLLLLPPAWPWWAPYAFLVVGFAMIAVLISTLSKKTA